MCLPGLLFVGGRKSDTAEEIFSSVRLPEVRNWSSGSGISTRGGWSMLTRFQTALGGARSGIRSEGSECGLAFPGP